MIIKSFKIFEELNCREFSEEIDKYLYPFTDEGFSVSNRYPDGVIAIYGNSVEFSKIKEDLLSLLSYISSVTDVYVDVEFEIIIGDKNYLKTFKISKNKFEDNFLSEIKDNFIIKTLNIEL